MKHFFKIIVCVIVFMVIVHVVILNNIEAATENLNHDKNSVSSTISNTSKNNIDQNRNEFIQNKKRIVDEYEKSLQDLSAQNDSLGQQLSAGEQHLNNISGNSIELSLKSEALTKVYEFVWRILYPARLLLDWIPKIKEFLFILTIINIALYLRYRQKAFFERYKKKILICSLICIIIFISPSFVGAADAQVIDSNTPQPSDTYLQKLKDINELLNKNPVQQMILKLESAKGNKGQQVIQSKLPINDELFNKLDAVAVGHASYYYALAILYNEDGSVGKAVDAIKQMFNESSITSNEDIIFYVNGVQLLLNHNQPEAAKAVIPFLTPRLTNFSQAEDMVYALLNAELQISAKEVLKKAVQIGNTDGSALALIEELHKKGFSDVARSGIEEAFNIVDNMEKNILLIQLSFSFGYNDLALIGINRAPKLLSSIEQLEKLIFLLMKNNQKESAINILANLIKDMQKERSGSSSILLGITRIAVNNQLYEQAIAALEKMFYCLGTDAKSNSTNPPKILSSENTLPAEGEQISIATFFGAVQEKAGFKDKAETAYKRATSWRLDEIAENYGLDGFRWINDFYYAWQLLPNNASPELLKSFDSVYKHIESAYLVTFNKSLRSRIKEIELEVESKKQRVKDQENKIRSEKSQLSKLRLKIILSSFRLLIIAILIFSLLTWCIWRAWGYQKGILNQKFFAFVSSFIESIGWVQITTIINVVFGVILVFIAQGFVIFQQILENTNFIMKNRSLQD